MDLAALELLLLKLYNQSFRTIPGSKKQLEIRNKIDDINKQINLLKSNNK